MLAGDDASEEPDPYDATNLATAGASAAVRLVDRECESPLNMASMLVLREAETGAPTTEGLDVGGLAIADGGGKAPPVSD